jgi:glycosyltransferase involved in cell wall biosynthesis
MEISVIIPTFNRRERLRKALQSVIIQEGASFEVIVIDDGSTDATGQMLREEFPSARYFSQDRQGPSAARNRGIEKAQGEWIAFLDSDDEWMPGKLAAQLEFSKQNPEYLIHQTEEIWIRNGRRVNPMKKHQKYGGWIFEKCLPLCIISPSAVMMRRKLFEEIGLFDETLPACEDYDLWLRVTSRYPAGLIEKAYVIKYGGHRDQRSHEFPAMDQFRIQSLAKLLKSGGLSPEQEQIVRITLEEKSRIYIQGALKRGKQEEVIKLYETLQTSKNLY